MNTDKRFQSQIRKKKWVEVEEEGEFSITERRIQNYPR